MRRNVGGKSWRDHPGLKSSSSGLGLGDLPPTISSWFRFLVNGNSIVTGNERFGGKAGLPVFVLCPEVPGVGADAICALDPLSAASWISVSCVGLVDRGF